MGEVTDTDQTRPSSGAYVQSKRKDTNNSKGSDPGKTTMNRTDMGRHTPNGTSKGHQNGKGKDPQNGKCKGPQSSSDKDTQNGKGKGPRVIKRTHWMKRMGTLSDMILAGHTAAAKELAKSYRWRLEQWAEQMQREGYEVAEDSD